MCNNIEQPKPNPRPHAALIKAWADGAVIEYMIDGQWQPCNSPAWYAKYQYRIKPEQTDVEKYGVEVGDLWYTRNDQTLTVRSRLSCGVITLSSGVCVDNVHLKTLLFRRGVVNKL